MNQKLNKTMKVVAIDRFGGIETLKTRQLSIPDVGANEVLVRVEAAGVGVWDPFEREGGFAKEYNVQPTFPLVLGSDGAGTVEAVGDGVQTLKKGDRVYGIALMNPKGGFYAQYIVLKETNLSRIPAKAKLTIQQAGAMPVDAITALTGLDATLGLKANESILILGTNEQVDLSFGVIVRFDDGHLRSRSHAFHQAIRNQLAKSFFGPSCQRRFPLVTGILRNP